MTVGGRFREFFTALNDGMDPYPWQCDLAEEIAETGVWPDIAAPTGAGKSAVIDIHVFLVAMHASGCRVARPPRRLVLVAPRRVLVDDQFERARRIAERLKAARDGPEPLLAESAAALAGLKTGQQDPSESPLGVWTLRGGIRPDTGWRRDPAACQVICATPQMWGSRLLLRGYGASRRSRNVEAGMLGQDVVAIVDEAHLHRRLVETAHVVRAMDRGPAPLQVVAMSGTQPSEPGQRGLSDRDLDDQGLRARVRARKALDVITIDGAEGELQAALVDRAVAARTRIDFTSGSVGVFVNSVSTALAVAAELKRHGTVQVVCGRMRPADVAELRKRRPGLLTPKGDSSVGFLVSTQSLEVGVDLDLPAIVAVLAPANALAQRAGRLNRSGRFADSAFTVVALVDGEGEPVPRGAWMGPYGAEELADALRWLSALDGSISPWTVTHSEVPVPVRPPLPRLRRVDLETLAMTSDPLSADPDPDLYLQDPQRDPPQVSVIARRQLDENLDPQVIEAMLIACPPRAHEIASISIGRALDRILKAVREKAWIVRSFDDELQALPLAQVERPRPGDAVVVPDGARICTAGVIGLGEVSGTPEPFNDVLAVQVPGSTTDQIVRLSVRAIQPILADDPVLGSREARRRLAEVISDDSLARSLRQSRLSDLELLWCGVDDDEQDGLLVVREMTRRASAAPRIVTPESVRLCDHQRDVAGRLDLIVKALRFGGDELPSDQLLAAALAHDEGKQHPRFQERMGAGDEPLAKPRPGHRPDQGDGWRHEQLSAAFIAAESNGDPLTVTVVAAHHGRGRPVFDRGAVELLDRWNGCADDVRAWVSRLYGEGAEYEELRDRAQREHGVHGLSWYEALLCCADRQISAEGR